jgi:magnesium-transporting ATPase (P-type)
VARADNSHPKSFTLTNWHSQSVSLVFKELQCDIRGLSSKEAKDRLEKSGPNQIPSSKGESSIKRFFLQFNNVLIYVLLVAGFISVLLTQWVDAGVIFGVVLINAIIGFVQEGKAERALESIRSMLSPKANVIRDGHQISINAQELVPGDIVTLQEGDRVPADCRIVHSRNTRIDESILTGESVPVEKDSEPVEESANLGDRKSMVFSGTLVTFGKCSAVVVATGINTEIGKVSTLLRQVEQLSTPLLRQFSQFSKWLSLAILGLAAVTFAAGYFFRNYGIVSMFMSAVSLAVAAIPEGLPAIMTITLAIGVQRMAKRHAIIRKLPAVETLGSVTVICSDKTGTLTKNEMTVQSILTADELIRVSGSGYEPRGDFTIEGYPMPLEDNSPVLSEILRAAILCNNSSVYQKKGVWILSGEPTEGALVTAAMKNGIDQKQIREQFPRIDEIPFESRNKFMATLHHDHKRNGFIYIKGAPEVILARCTRQKSGLKINSLDLEYWKESMELIAAKGQRLMALASKYTTEDHRELHFDDLNSDLILLGVMGMFDPPREEAIRAVASCQSAGIRVKMITGDHTTTAMAIASLMGIGKSGSFISGQQLEEANDKEFREIVSRTDCFARTTPEHKLRLVEALQADGHVVAMTGDGVNDSPALKRADIGIAMGQKGSDAAKEASKMVLTDDNFASIVHAIEEGRTVYDNLIKAILFSLPTNGGEAFSIVIAIIAGLELPLTPVQILWVNMITAVTLALALAFEPAEPGIMERPPRKPDQPILTGFLIWRILFVSSILVAGTLGHFIILYNRGESVQLCRSAALNTLVAGELVYLFNSRYKIKPSWTWKGLSDSKAVLIASGLLILFQGLFIYMPLFQHLFGTVPIRNSEWLRIAVFVICLFLIVEFEKLVIRRFFSSSVT